MRTEFDITLNSKDLYRFSMYHAYTGCGQGMISIGILILCMIAAIKTYGSVSRTYTMLYAGLGVIVLMYIPISLYTRSKRQILSSEILKNALHYIVDETGVHISQNGASADLPWEQVYKMISTGNHVFIYSSRIHAYIIPISQIRQEYDSLRSLAETCLPKFRCRMK